MELAWNGAVKLTNINNLACLVPAVFHPRVETSPLTLRLAPMVTRQTNNPNQGNIPGSQFWFDASLDTWNVLWYGFLWRYISLCCRIKFAVFINLNYVMRIYLSSWCQKDKRMLWVWASLCPIVRINEAETQWTPDPPIVEWFLNLHLSG